MFRPDPKPEPKPKKTRRPIRRRSKKRASEERLYSKRRKEFLEKNSVCAVTGGKATEVHHMKGRDGHLLLDENYWLPVSREGHQKIELNPEWAYEMGYSVKRTT